MKLFGNSSRKRRGSVPDRRQEDRYTAPRTSGEQMPPSRGAQANKGKNTGMSGRTKGLILLAFSICLFLGSIVMCLSILYSSAAVAPTSKRPANKTQVLVDPDSSTSTLPQGGEDTIPDTDDGIFNILICGTDGDGGRTDTIIVANLNTGTN